MKIRIGVSDHEGSPGDLYVGSSRLDYLIQDMQNRDAKTVVARSTCLHFLHQNLCSVQKGPKTHPD